MSNGTVTQIIGAVIDVEFEKDNIPKVYEALLIDEGGITLEVQQQLGDGVVRTIAMGATEGLKRGLTASRTNAPISVPVGPETLGRIVDVLGNPIDEKGPIGEKQKMPIHRKPPSYTDQSVSNDVLETGIKVIDLMCPFAKGGKIGLFGGAGVGKTVNMMELINNIALFNIQVFQCLLVLVREPEKEMTSTMKCKNQALLTLITLANQKLPWYTAR